MGEVLKFSEKKPEEEKRVFEVLGEAARKLGLAGDFWEERRGSEPKHAQKMENYFRPREKGGWGLLEPEIYRDFCELVLGSKYEERLGFPKGRERSRDEEEEILNNRRYLLQAIGGLIEAEGEEARQKAAKRFAQVVKLIKDGIQLPIFSPIDEKGRLIKYIEQGKEISSSEILNRILDEIIAQGGKFNKEEMERWIRSLGKGVK